MLAKFPLIEAETSGPSHIAGSGQAPLASEECGTTTNTSNSNAALDGDVSGEGSRAAVSLLERIVKTHPIWYLQHLGRSAANHLLRPMPVGVFVVRSSSRSVVSAHTLSAVMNDSTSSIHSNGGGGGKSRRSSSNNTASGRATIMALSVRLPKHQGSDVDHYLLESCSGGVRLEGSGHVFKSLPHLLEHYCSQG